MPLLRKTWDDTVRKSIPPTLDSFWRFWSHPKCVPYIGDHSSLRRINAQFASAWHHGQSGIWRSDMAVSARVLIVMFALIWMFSGFVPRAEALGKHGQKPPRAFRHAKKNASPYAYLAGPKKQKKSNGYYRSTLTGEVVYGKPPKGR